MLRDPIDVVLHHEGGYVNHPNDRGGPTKYGVTQATYSHWLGREATLQEVKDMDIETARDIYESNYLTGPRIHLLPEPPQTLVLDMGINHGPRNAIRMVQRVTNAAGVGPIAVDGRLGPRSRTAVDAAIAKLGPVVFQNALVEERIRYYHSKVQQYPQNAVFLKGWLRRAESFRLT